MLKHVQGGHSDTQDTSPSRLRQSLRAQSSMHACLCIRCGHSCLTIGLNEHACGRAAQHGAEAALKLSFLICGVGAIASELVMPSPAHDVSAWHAQLSFHHAHPVLHTDHIGEGVFTTVHLPGDIAHHDMVRIHLHASHSHTASTFDLKRVAHGSSSRGPMMPATTCHRRMKGLARSRA